MMGDSLTLSAFQKHIRDRYYATDAARGSAKTFVWFIEEVGELATALNGEAASEENRANLREEFADVFAWLLTLANIQGVDLQKAIDRKYFKDGGPQGHK